MSLKWFLSGNGQSSELKRELLKRTCEGRVNRMALQNELLIVSNSCFTAVFAMFSVWLVSMLRPLLGRRKRWRCVILYGMAFHWGLLVRTKAVEETSPSSQSLR